ncbi:MAG: glycosyltransferase [Pseudomonadota bacterium]
MTDNRLKYEREIAAGAEDSLSRLAGMIPQGATVMDLGVGSGELGAWLVREKQCVVDGIEMSADHIERAAPLYRSLQQVDLEQPDAFAEFELASYDRVVFADVLEHVLDREGVLRRAASLLKPDGELLLSVPNVGYAGVVLDLLEGRFDYRDEGILDDTHVRFYTRDSLSRFLASLGFSIVQIDTITRPMHTTEFADFAPELLPTSLVNALLERPDALVYQYILRVRCNGEASMDVPPTTGIVNRFETRLFWMSEGDLQHGEHKLQRQWATLNADDNRLNFSIEDAAGIEVLRYFPADRAGVVHLKRFEVQAGDNRIDLCTAAALDAALTQHLLAHHEAGAYTLLCQDGNAWFEIPLEPLLGGARPTRIEVIIEQSWPLSQDYKALLAAFADSDRKLSELADQLVEQRAHRRGLAGEIALLKTRLEEREQEMAELRSNAVVIRRVTDLVALARQLLGQLWRRRRGLFSFPLTLTAVTHGEQQAGGWLAMTGDSGHLYYQIPARLRGHVLYFRIRFEAEDRLWGPKLYTVVDGELHEMMAPMYEHRDGKTIFGTLEAQDELQGLVFAPSRLDCRVRVKTFRLRRVPAWLVEMEDSWRWLWYYRCFGARWTWERAREDFALWTENWPQLGTKREYADWWESYGKTPEAELMAQRRRAAAFESPPTISIVMPTYNTPPALLEKALASVLEQTYPHWQLCIADDCSTQEDTRASLRALAEKDERIAVHWRDSNGHISAATNDAIGLATGDYVAFMDHDDALTPNALYEVAIVLQQAQPPRLVYTDEDIVAADDAPIRPHFKPDWNPDYLASINYFCHLVVMERALLDEVGQLREGYEGAQDYDLVLRATEVLQPEHIHHIPKVLYHWRAVEGSTAEDIDHKGYAVDAGVCALADQIARLGQDAEVELSEMGMAYRVRHSLPDPTPSVEILMPTRDSLDVLSHCVGSVLTRTDYADFRLTIIDNGSEDPACLDYLETLASEERVRVLRYDREFNFAAIMNFGARQSDAELLLLMNNDMEVINSDWLEELASQAVREDIGAVGAKLFFATDYIQHAGVVLGVGPDAVAGHAFRGFYKSQTGHMGRLRLVQNYSAVTAACLALRRETFLEVGGMDEDNLAVAFNDVDLCLKLVDAGYRNLWTPYAQLFHFESYSRGHEIGEKRLRFERERDFMQQKWGRRLFEDPAYNPNLTLQYESFDLAWPPRC